MHRTPLELMRSHLRDIHQAVTGKELPDEAAKLEVPSGAELSQDGVMRLFTELEVVARTLPEVATRVPPFSFTPPVDLLENDRALIAEVAVPGVERDDVAVEVKGELLIVSGSREQRGAHDSPRFVHAEIARGPFRRVVQLPHAVTDELKVNVERGLIRIELTKAPAH
jgi:HSP20 family molecular chaperone IbpA